MFIEENLRRAEEARAKQMEAIQRAREEAAKLQAEARARAEAARAEQLAQFQVFYYIIKIHFYC